MRAVEKSKNFPVDVAFAASQGTARPQSRDAERFGLASERKLALADLGMETLNLTPAAGYGIATAARMLASSDPAAASYRHKFGSGGLHSAAPVRRDQACMPTNADDAAVSTELATALVRCLFVPLACCKRNTIPDS